MLQAMNLIPFDTDIQPDDGEHRDANRIWDRVDEINTWFDETADNVMKASWHIAARELNTAIFNNVLIRFSDDSHQVGSGRAFSRDHHRPILHVGSFYGYQGT